MKVFRSTVKGIVKVTKPLVNFPAWMGLNQILSTAKGIKNTAKGLVETTSKPVHDETFKEAIKRLHLSEKDIQQRQKTFYRNALIYAGIGLLLLGYAIYLVIGSHFAASFLSLVLFVLALALAFKQHFYYFQMKQRKLGCTVQDWLSAFFRGTKR